MTPLNRAHVNIGKIASISTARRPRQKRERGVAAGSLDVYAQA